jgi:hypothetical protein
MVLQLFCRHSLNLFCFYTANMVAVAIAVQKKKRSETGLSTKYTSSFVTLHSFLIQAVNV